jgi:hypothetical protein
MERKINSLESLLKLAERYKDIRYFPLSKGVGYSEHEGQILFRSDWWWRSCESIRLDFKKLDTSSLQLVLECGVGVNSYPKKARRRELLAILEAKTISYPEFKLEIEEQIQKYKLALMNKQQANKRREEERAFQLETFRNNWSLNLDATVEKYAEVLGLKETESLDLSHFDTEENVDELARELETSPATYRLLIELHKALENLKESDQKLRRKLRRIKLTLSGKSGYSSDCCRCGYTSSGSYVGGTCHCGYGNESD